jgi:hypothetical protein
MTYDVCFGYEVRSDLTFEYLREGGATGVLQVAETRREDPGQNGEPLREWLPRPDRPFTARLFREDGRWRLWVADIGSFHIDAAAGSIEVPEGAPSLLREERLWGIPTVLCFLSRGDHSLHAASVESTGRAIAVGAPGRFGKTTLAAALVGAGHRLLSEDSTCIRLSEGGISVVPGPAMLRVRRDPERAVEIPGTRAIQIDERVHLAVEPDRRGDGAPVPLDAIVLLREADEDHPRLERVLPEEAIPDLWALSFSTPTDEDRRRCFDGVARLAASVPIWNLHRPLRYDVLDDVIRQLEQVPSR